ncbi:YqhA family protein [Roseateles sp.]|uniref:YqhA family protein n=1 Tax=Roseateles sp. TaxID=1971397 RepID=UPI0031DE9C15
MSRLLAATRHMMLLAVVGSLIVALALLCFGGGLVALTVFRLATGQTGLSASDGKQLSLVAIEIIDLFLIATVAYVTAVGLYKLFVGRDVPGLLHLGIDSLDQLKHKIIGVVIVALGVLFLGAAMNHDGTPGLLYLGVATALVIAALTYFMRQDPGSH